jgi:uncharacterized membrane protein required for colicin V production
MELAFFRASLSAHSTWREENDDSMSFRLDQLPINAFDFTLVAVLIFGLWSGRKHGMSQELINVLKWVTILVVCSLVYQPGGQFFKSFGSMFSLLFCYILAYIVAAVVVIALFALIKRALGGKLLGSDVFGPAEYYLGMGSGLVRFLCILIFVLAMLNARYYSPTEVKAMQKFQDDVYGSNFFPTMQSVQETVFQKSITGSWIKENLSFLLIKPTAPENTDLHQKEAAIP